MEKFWNKSETTNEILIYGDITAERWEESDVTAKSFSDDLKSFGGKDITVRINSGGGDVFNALAIYNSLKNYKGKVTIAIDGIAASAASLIICAGDKVTMASNALIMVHTPSVGLLGYYSAAELNKVINSLVAVEGSILNTYKQRLPEKNHAEIAKMVTAETYLDAESAKDLGFVDEITDAVEMEIDNSANLLYANHITVDVKNFDTKKFSAVLKAQEVVKMAENKVEVTGTSANETLDVKQANEILIQDAVKQAREQEIQRIKNLMTLKNGVAEVDAIIDVAIVEGGEVADVAKYVDAIKKVKPPSVDKPKTLAVDVITREIRDNMTSGAEGIGGSMPQSPEDMQKFLSAEIVKYANEMIGGAKNGGK